MMTTTAMACFCQGTARYDRPSERPSRPSGPAGSPRPRCRKLPRDQRTRPQRWKIMRFSHGKWETYGENGGFSYENHMKMMGNGNIIGKTRGKSLVFNGKSWDMLSEQEGIAFGKSREPMGKSSNIFDDGMFHAFAFGER